MTCWRCCPCGRHSALQVGFGAPAANLHRARNRVLLVDDVPRVGYDGRILIRERVVAHARAAKRVAHDVADRHLAARAARDVECGERGYGAAQAVAAGEHPSLCQRPHSKQLAHEVEHFLIDAVDGVGAQKAAVHARHMPLVAPLWRVHRLQNLQRHTSSCRHVRCRLLSAHSSPFHGVQQLQLFTHYKPYTPSACPSQASSSPNWPAYKTGQRKAMYFFLLKVGHRC